MNIEAKLSSDMTGFKPHWHAETKTRLLALTFVTRIEEDKAKKIGERFHAIAFGGMERKDGKVTHSYATLKPRVVCGDHQVTIEGIGPLSVQPKLKSLEALADEEAVLLTFELLLDVQKGKLAGDLFMGYGTQVDVALKFVQHELPLSGEAAGGKVVKIKRGRFGNSEPVKA